MEQWDVPRTSEKAPDATHANAECASVQRRRDSTKGCDLLNWRLTHSPFDRSSHGKPSSELRNCRTAPHSLHRPRLVGPSGLSRSQWCWQGCLCRSALMYRAPFSTGKEQSGDWSRYPPPGRLNRDPRLVRLSQFAGNVHEGPANLELKGDEFSDHRGCRPIPQ